MGGDESSPRDNQSSSNDLMTSGGSLHVRSTDSIRSAVAVRETLGVNNSKIFLMTTVSPLASSVSNSSGADSSRKHDGITSSILGRSSLFVATGTDLSFNSSTLTSGYYHENSSFSVDVAASAVTMATMINVTTAKIKVEEDKKFKYYSYKILTDDELAFDTYWRKDEEIMTGKHREVLERQYLTAVTVKLNFTFIFYGHEVDSITVATGGFLYMSDFLHDRLTYSQYIAPLMANFGTESLNQSHIHYSGNDTSFTVWWENVTLRDYPSAGQFSFQATLFKNGRIAFVYDSIPVPIGSIPSQFHSVRAGLSDAYYFDEVTSAGYTERKISEYNRVTVSVTVIGNRSVVVIEPLPTCIQQKSCSSCLTAATTLPFACQWCPQLKRCSDGFDRKRQQWLNYGCNNERVTALRGCSANRVRLGFVTIIVVIVAALVSGVAWLCYAHTHPNSSSGRWLIEHRPRACLDLFRKAACCQSPTRRERYVSYQSGLESLA